VARLKSVGKQAVASRAADRREQIMRGAGAVLRERKGSALNMQQVADRVGLVKGNIYYYFEDRQDLLYHCHVKCVEMSLAALDEIAARIDLSPRERLRQLIVRHIEASLGSDYGGVLRSDMDEMKPAQRKRYVVLRDRFEAGVRRLVEEGAAKGEFRNTSAALAGFAILGSINWMHKWYREDGAMDLAALARWFADYFIAGLRK
jgi:AcrR family transcriptional regulator